MTTRPGPMISACIIAMDEADRIERCLSSVDWADEVLVIDSGSSDETVALCQKAGARVIETDWPGWVAQKQRAVDAATHDWIFAIDADERVDEELRTALLALRDGALQDPTTPRAYAVCRKVWFLGQWIRHGGWYPEWRTRLFHRGHAHWAGVDPHDRVEVDGAKVRIRRGHLEHYTYRSMEDYLRKTNRFSSVAAAEKHKRGRKASWWDLTMRPPFRFVRMFLWRRGFLDGRAGFILASLAAYSVFLKYAKLWNLARRQAEGVPADA